jgi:hypothetical protein
METHMLPMENVVQFYTELTSDSTVFFHKQASPKILHPDTGSTLLFYQA